MQALKQGPLDAVKGVLQPLQLLDGVLLTRGKGKEELLLARGVPQRLAQSDNNASARPPALSTAHRIVQKEAIVQVKGVVRGVVHEVDQSLEAPRVDRRLLNLQGRCEGVAVTLEKTSLPRTYSPSFINDSPLAPAPSRLHLAEHPPHGVREKLRGSCLGVVLAAAHLHHGATLMREKLRRRLREHSTAALGLRI